MKKTMQLACLLLALLLVGPVFGQSKTYEQWKSDFDDVVFGSFSYDNQSGLSAQVASTLKSHSGHDMYFEGLGVIIPLTKAWQASGDFTYLDLALDIVQSDVRAAVDLQDYYNTYPNGPTGNLGSFDARPYPFKGHPAHRNYFQETTGLPWSGNEFFYIQQRSYSDYMNNASDGDANGVQFTLYRSYGHMSIQPSNGPEGVYNSLQTSIYWRFPADLVRIMYNNDGNNGFSLDQVSNNGQTYRQRAQEIIDFLENEYIAMWRDHSPANPGAWFYRVNTHMASHFASISLSLYVVTGKAEYLATVNQWLYDWGAAPLSPRPDGVGFMDQLRLETLNSIQGYYWANNWGSTGGYTDIGHAHAELHLLSQIYDEGLGQSPPDGSPVIDATFISRISGMMNGGVLQGYTCADGANEPQIKYYLDGSGGNDGLTAGSALWSIYEPNILCHMEQQDRFNWDEISIRGIGMYAAKVHGVNGTTAPVFPSDGGTGGTPPSNNAPVVTLTGENVINLSVGDTFIDDGASWTDIQDGTGTIVTATSGSVNTATPGTYVLIYSYTDAGGLTASVIRTVNVTAVGVNNCPVVSITNKTSPTTLALDATYTEEGGTYVDSEDGSGAATIGGDTVDTSTAGTYFVTYTYTDAAGCTDVATLEVIVENTTAIVPVTSILKDFSGKTYKIRSLDTFLPPVQVFPTNATYLDDLIYTSNDLQVVGQPGSESFLPEKDGFVTVRVEAPSGAFIDIIIEVILTDSKKKKNVLIGW